MSSKMATLALLCTVSSLCYAVDRENLFQPLPLREGWSLQSGCKIQAQGEAISTASFETKGWYSVTVPSTVLAAQVAAGTFPDPYYGDNLRKIPGTNYPVGTNFSNRPMSDDSPYRCSWWYRKQFFIPPQTRGTRSGCGSGASTIEPMSG